MAEFNETLVITELEDTDVIPCVDVSDQKRLKQLPISRLKQVLGGGAANPGNTPPNPATAQAWAQPDPAEGPALDWVWHPGVERWVSRERLRVGYWKDSGYSSSFRGAVPITTPEILFDSITISLISNGNFTAGERREIEILPVDTNKQSFVLARKRIEGLTKNQAYKSNDRLDLLVPQSDCLYLNLKGKAYNGPPSIPNFSIYVYLRAVYDPGNPPE